MKFIILSLFSFNLLAAEVITFQSNRSSKEILFSFTDQALYQAADKYFMAHTCKIRTVTTTVRESYMPTVCRAELMKFILDNGYKVLDARTFYK